MVLLPMAPYPLNQTQLITHERANHFLGLEVFIECMVLLPMAP
jgi:hypothetical protein